MARHILKYVGRRGSVRPVTRLLLLLMPLLPALGCAAPPTNPSFPVSVVDAQRALGEMRTAPKPLVRPLVVLGGMNDPGFTSGMLRGRFRKLTGDDRVIGVAFVFCGDFDDCRRRVIEAVDRAFPSDDPDFTTEVDVLAASMGGLVARYAAAPRAEDTGADAGAGEAGGRRLRIARLFTISSPHRGAAWAMLPTFSRLHLDMRPNSAFLRDLSSAESASGAYEIYPYVRLGDQVVGVANTAPHGQVAWWVPGQMFQDAHMMAAADARILADVARRLRGEEPLTSYPPQPPPGAAGSAAQAAQPPPAPRPDGHTAEPAPDTGVPGTTFALR